MLLNQTKNISRVFSTRLPEHFRGFKNFQSRHKCISFFPTSDAHLLTLQTFNEGSLFSADVSSGASMNEDIEVVAGAASVLAQQAGVVSLKGIAIWRIRAMVSVNSLVLIEKHCA